MIGDQFWIRQLFAGMVQDLDFHDPVPVDAVQDSPGGRNPSSAPDRLRFPRRG